MRHASRRLQAWLISDVRQKMTAVLPALFHLVGYVAVAGFVAGFAAHIQLQFCIDRDRVREKTGHDGLKILGSLMAPVEFYKKEAHVVWKIRDLGLKAFAVCAGVMALIALWAAVADVKLE